MTDGGGTDVDVREALYTTRAMRRMRDERVPEPVLARILDAAVRAPSGGNAQGWRFLVVDDPDVMSRLAPVYRACIDHLWASVYAGQIAAARSEPDTADAQAFWRMHRSVEHQAENFARIPLLVFAFGQSDASGGSTFPALWSALLAARAEGVGGVLLQAFVFRKDEALGVLGVPPDAGWTMNACIALGYPTGRWGVAVRRPVHEVTFRNGWGRPLGLEIPGPLWPDPTP